MDEERDIDSKSALEQSNVQFKYIHHHLGLFGLRENLCISPDSGAAW